MNSRWKQTIARFLTVQTISLFGSSLVQYTIIWYITLSTSSDRMLAIFIICDFAPQIIISLFAGVWVDRYDHEKLIMVPDAVTALATPALAAAPLFGCREIRLLFIVLSVRSMGTGIQTPAMNAVIPQIVPPWHLIRVNGIQGTLTSPMVFLSPAVSGTILSAAGLEATLLTGMATALIGVGIASALTIPMYRKNTVKGNTQIDSLKGGFRYLRSDTSVRRLLIFQITILFLISPSALLTPLTVNRTFGSQVQRLTTSEATYSIGIMLGGLLITSWDGFKRRLNTTFIAGAAYGILMLGLGTASAFWTHLTLNTMTGIATPCYQSPVTVSIQERVESSMQGRIFSFMQISTSCVLSLGMMAFDPLVDAVRIQYLLIGGGLAVTACTAGMVLKNGLSNIQAKKQDNQTYSVLLSCFNRHIYCYNWKIPIHPSTQ